jgi:hypothetical protein
MESFMAPHECLLENFMAPCAVTIFLKLVTFALLVYFAEPGTLGDARVIIADASSKLHVQACAMVIGYDGGW